MLKRFTMCSMISHSNFSLNFSHFIKATNCMSQAHAQQQRDPGLTHLGTTQCGSLRRHLQDNLPLVQHVELIVVSPMRRTIQTALFAFSWLVQSGVPVLARGEWQENSDKPCDTGSRAEDLINEFPDVDFSQLDPLYPSKTGSYAFNRESITRRGIDARRWLCRRSERVVCQILLFYIFVQYNVIHTDSEAQIAVVSHSSFLRTSVAHSWFMNADYRIFTFASGVSVPHGTWTEWEWTAKRGGGMARSFKGIAEARFQDFGEI